MADFALAYNFVRIWEGGYCNDPIDAGGETVYGISRRAHPNWAGWVLVDRGEYGSPALQMLAETLYRLDYWRPLRCEEYASQRLAIICFQAAVNCSVRAVSQWLQREINVYLNPDLAPDGVIGPRTLAALSDQMGHIDEICDGMLARQRLLYFSLCERKPTQKKFLRGWLARVKNL